MTGSTFDDNASGGFDGDGGAITTDGTDLSVSGSTFEDNIANYGGAIYHRGLLGDSGRSRSRQARSRTTRGAATTTTAVRSTTRKETCRSRTAPSTATSPGTTAALCTTTAETACTSSTTPSTATWRIWAGRSTSRRRPSTGTINLLNDTITRNSAYYGGGIAYPGYANSIENTIVAGNLGGLTTDGGGDCYGSGLTANAGAADKGGNIDSDGTCFSNIISRDQTSVNPGLGPLSNNGGPTGTDAELTGSPAIGTAQAGFCPLTDQRGVSRPSTSCDVGAYQSASAGLAVSGSGPKKANVGNPVSETFQLTNNGPAPATGVTLSDSLPASTALSSWSASQGSCTGGTTVTCSLGTINSGATGSPTTASVTIVLVPMKAVVLTDQAKVSAANSTAVSASVQTTVSPAGTLPVVLTAPASKVSRTGARLSALVNPADESTTYSFQYGTSRSYGKTVHGRKLNAGTNPVLVSVSVSSLKAGKTYHFRIVATNASGTRRGQDVTFTTLKPKPKPKPKH